MRRIFGIVLLWFPLVFVAQNSSGLDSIYYRFYKQLNAKDTGAWKELKMLEGLSASDKAAVVYFNLAKADSYIDEGEREQAFGACMNALDVAKELKSDSLLFRAYFKIGFLYLEFNDLTHALPYFNRSLLLIGSVKNLNDRILLYRNVGLLYSYLDKNKESIEYLLKMEPLVIQTQNKKMLGSVYNNLGVNFVDLHDSATALKYYRKSMAIRKEIGDGYGIGQLTNNFGSLYYAFGEYNKALEYFKQGLELRKKANVELPGIIESGVNIGKTYYKLKNVQKAKEYLEEAREEALKMGHIELERRTNEELVGIYSAAGDFRKAFELQSRYFLIKDSLYGLNKKEEIGRLNFENKIREDSLKHEEMQQKERAVSEEKEKRTALIRNIFMGGFSVVLLVAFLLFKQVKRIQSANRTIARQKEEIEQKQKEMLDSIYYARRIQRSLLPSETLIKRVLAKLRKNG